MEAPGRPTPPAEHPRYKDPERPDFGDKVLNEHYALHLAFGTELLPAAEAWKWRDRWHEQVGLPATAPVHLEIGSGNGFFLTGLARRNPDWVVLGVEIRYKRCTLCARKLRTAGITNARIIRYDAAYLDDLVTPGTLAGLYVNHPDPWPKDKHEKHRLISRWFLEKAAELLVPGGELRIKSDFPPNVDRVAEILGDPSLPPLPLRITGRSDDIVRDGAPWPDDIETNYQRKKREAGVPVLALTVVRDPGPVVPADSAPPPGTRKRGGSSA